MGSYGYNDAETRSHISLKNTADMSESTAQEPPISRPGGVFSHPVPDGLIAASKKASKAKTSSMSKLTDASPARLFSTARGKDSGKAQSRGNDLSLQVQGLPKFTGFPAMPVAKERDEGEPKWSQERGEPLEDPEIEKPLHEWRNTDHLRRTENSGFGVSDRGMRDIESSPKQSAEYYLKLGAAARDMNKAISPMVDSGGFENDMSSAWLLTRGLRVHGEVEDKKVDMPPGKRKGKREEDDGLELVTVSPIEYSKTPESEDDIKRRLLEWKEEAMKNLRNMLQAVKVEVATKAVVRDELVPEDRRRRRYHGLALVNISPIDSPGEGKRDEVDRRLLEWNAESSSYLKDITKEVKTEVSAPKGAARGESPAEERRRRRRMERGESATTSIRTTPAAASAELVQNEWRKNI